MGAIIKGELPVQIRVINLIYAKTKLPTLCFFMPLNPSDHVEFLTDIRLIVD